MPADVEPADLGNLLVSAMGEGLSARARLGLTLIAGGAVANIYYNQPLLGLLVGEFGDLGVDADGPFSVPALAALLGGIGFGGAAAVSLLPGSLPDAAGRSSVTTRSPAASASSAATCCAVGRTAGSFARQRSHSATTRAGTPGRYGSGAGSA